VAFRASRTNRRGEGRVWRLGSGVAFPLHTCSLLGCFILLVISGTVLPAAGRPVRYAARSAEPARSSVLLMGRARTIALAIFRALLSSPSSFGDQIGKPFNENRLPQLGHFEIMGSQNTLPALWLLDRPGRIRTGGNSRFFDFFSAKHNPKSSFRVGRWRGLNAQIALHHTVGAINKSSDVPRRIAFRAGGLDTGRTLAAGRFRRRMPAICTRGLARWSLIPYVFEMRSDLQVFWAIVQPVMIQVVGFKALGAIGDKAMKPDGSSFSRSIATHTVSSDGRGHVVCAIAFRFLHTPRSGMLHHFMKSVCIHQSMQVLRFSHRFFHVHVRPYPPQFNGEVVASVVPFVEHHGKYAMQKAAKSSAMGFAEYYPLHIVVLDASRHVDSFSMTYKPYHRDFTPQNLVERGHRSAESFRENNSLRFQQVEGGRCADSGYYVNSLGQNQYLKSLSDTATWAIPASFKNGDAGANAGVETGGVTGEPECGNEAGFDLSKFARMPFMNRKNQPYSALNGLLPVVPGSGRALTAALKIMAPTAPEKGWSNQFAVSVDIDVGAISEASIALRGDHPKSGKVLSPEVQKS